MNDSMTVRLMREFVDQLEGPGSWQTFPQQVKDEYVSVYKEAHARTYGKACDKAREIVELTCKALGIAPEIVRGPGKSTSQVRARRIAAYMVRTSIWPRVSMSEIARSLGRCHHTSILEQLQMVERGLEVGDPEYVEAVAKAKAVICGEGRKERAK